jgi:hypothetical protein
MKIINNNSKQSNQSNQSIKQFKNQNTMKTKITILAAMFFIATISSYATVRTVSNHPLDGAQYTSLQAAYNAAANGDTLLIEGTPNIYYIGNEWSKVLTVIGNGLNPQKQSSQQTMFRDQYYGATRFNSSGNGSKFYGITFIQYEVWISGSVNDYTFENCRFDVRFSFNDNSATNIIFRNCIFNPDNNENLRLSNGATTTVSIQNCIFDGLIVGQSSNFNTLLIDHCIFLRTNDAPLQDIKNASITNSIFMNFASIANSNTTGCTFLNNISRLATTYPPAGNSGSGNLSSTNPNFVNYSLGSFYSTAYDYHLQSGSAAIGAGSDATDIGIHGGTSKFSEQGEPLNAPVMRSMQINNTSVAPNGTLNVDINASKPDDN